MFKKEVNDYLVKEMSICDKYIDLISSEFYNDKSLIENYLEYLINCTLPCKSSKPGSDNWITNAMYYEDYYKSFWSEYNINEDCNSYMIFDDFRDAFFKFKMQGLIGLYEGMDSEIKFYPKVLLKKHYGKKQDIYELDESIIIYRGTSKNEFEKGSFSQAWTLDYEEAKKFAFEHYSGEEFSETFRVILKTKISKSDIFYFDKQNIEKEVVVNPERIIKDNVDIEEEQFLD